MDFWLLGGISLVVWLLVLLGDHFKGSNPAIARYLRDLPYAFALLTLVCNHPHFISSYKFGYGRGLGFIGRHWLALVAVPILLVGALSSGIESLSLCVWAMWLTVGWHYAKQVFGCMMLYSRYDGYSLSNLQKRAFHANLLALVLVNFTYYHGYSPGPNQFMGMPVMQLSLLPILFSVSSGLFGASAGILAAIFIHKFSTERKLPSFNFLVSGAAFYVWWIPGVFPIEYSIFVVPFFHSLQYLPFSYKVISSQKSGKSPFGLTFQILLILAIGAVAFDILPSALDEAAQSQFNFGCAYFMIAITVFLNIHHFFIDSVTWRSDQPEFRDALL